MAPLRSRYALLAVGLTAVLSLAAPPTARAVDLRLPRHVCDANLFFSGGFETHWQPQSSGGSGGATGSGQRSVSVPGIGTKSFAYHVPVGASLPMPTVVVMHGAAGPGQAAAAASATRNDWIALANAGGFAVLAPIASGAQGGWVPEVDFPTLDAVLADARASYPLDLTRTYLWGFSAGGHVAHALALLRDPQRYAAYAVSAGVLDAYAGASAPSLATRHLPLHISVGSADSLFPFAQTDRDRFVAAGWVLGGNLQFVPFSGGHTYGATQLQGIWAGFCPRAVVP